MTLADSTCQGHSGSGINDYKEVFDTPQISRSETSLSNAVSCHTHDIFSRE